MNKSIKPFSTFFFFTSMLALLFFIEAYQPTIASWIPPMLLILGITFVVLGLVGYGRYRHVFDHEKTTLLGRTTNGRNARSLLKMSVLLADG